MVKLAVVVIIVAFHATIIQCNPTFIPQDQSNVSMQCPSEEKLNAAMNDLRSRTQEILIQAVAVSTTGSPSIPDTTTTPSGNALCGSGNWRPFFFLNMSDTSQSCPSGWIFTQSRGYRSCTGMDFSCDSTYISPGLQGYSEVCGMLAGVGTGHPDGFHRLSSDDMQSIERNYLDGVSITYGSAGSRQHVWSLAVGHTYRCPCDVHSSGVAQPPPPSEVGNNYYCSSKPLDEDTPVWQGVDCRADNPCCSYNNPPVFKVQLAATTTQTMELRICSDEFSTSIDSNERLYVRYAEIYVQ